MAEPVLNAVGVVASIGQRVATGVPEHVSVDRKGESSTRADALDEPVDRIGREPAAALGGEDEGRDRGMPAQPTQRGGGESAARGPSHVPSNPMDRQSQRVDMVSKSCMDGRYRHLTRGRNQSLEQTG